MRRALLYATFNGVANCTNGIGRQTKTLLSAIERRWDEVTAVTGPLTPYLAIPTPGPRTWAYDPQQLGTATRVVQARGGRILHLPHDTAPPFWSPPVWTQLSAAAVRTAATIAADYDEVLLIAVDTPFLGSGRVHRTLPSELTARIHVLLAPYGTSYIHDRPPDPWRLGWERTGLGAVGGRVHVADIGAFLTRHLVRRFDVDPACFVPWRSSLDLTAPDFTPMDRAQAAAVLAEFEIPTDRPIVMFIGRSDPTKGFDLLIDALRPIADNVHLAAVVVAGPGRDPLIPEYIEQINRARVRASLVTQFTRDLPRALAAHPATRVAVCPSRGESLANVPFEVSLWARRSGPVIVAPNRDGFVEQISDGVNGLLYDPDQDGALTTGIRRALALGPGAAAMLRTAAHQRVVDSRDVVPNLADTARWCFQLSRVGGYSSVRS
ncbi:glycosyltransferase family 4 protein [Plantactinospora sp. CA-290183]|uniref:glycosyltransferase family 4 protein n=1 Tax=Plantactinospora sp. CA-290183 TaxID=3240006 RepID=UPI003D8E7212